MSKRTKCVTCGKRRVICETCSHCNDCGHHPSCSARIPPSFVTNPVPVAVDHPEDASILASFVAEVEQHQKRESLDYGKLTVKRGLLVEVPEGHTFRYGTVIKQVPGMTTVQYDDGERLAISPHTDVEFGTAVERGRKQKVTVVDGAVKVKKAPAVARTTIFDHPATRVVMWLGAKGITTKQAESVLLALEHYGVNSTTASVSTFLRAGAKGERGEPAPLTEAQGAELMALLHTISEKQPAK